MAYQSPGYFVATPPADTPTPFDSTLAVADTAEDLVTVPALKTGRSFTLKNKGPGSVFLAFDADATTAGVEVEAKDNYSESNIEIGTRVSFIGAAGKTPRVFGVLWSGE